MHPHKVDTHCVWHGIRTHDQASMRTAQQDTRTGPAYSHCRIQDVPQGASYSARTSEEERP